MSAGGNTDTPENTPANGAAEPHFVGGISHAWRALRHRNFRLFFGGQTISLIGTWMTRIATSWLVYRLTGSALLLGTVSFAGQIPTFLLAPFAGVWVDRLDRRLVLVWTQTLAMLQSFAAGRPHPLPPHHRCRYPGAQRASRVDQRFRHARAAVLHGADDRGPGATSATPSPSTRRW